MKEKIIEEYRNAQCDVDLYIVEEIQQKIHLGFTSEEVKSDLLKEHRCRLNNSHYAGVISKYFEIVNDFGQGNDSSSLFASLISSQENAKASDDFYGLFLSMLIVDRLKVKPKSEEIESKSEEKCKPEFTIEEIAMICYLEGKPFDSKKADNIIKKYGLSSGKKLYMKYNKFLHTKNFLNGIGDLSDVQYKNLIKRFDNIIDALDDNAKQKAEELKLRVINKRD